MMTKKEFEAAKALWTETVTIAHRVFVAARAGLPIEPAVAGGLAERVLAVETQRIQHANDEAEDET